MTGPAETPEWQAPCYSRVSLVLTFSDGKCTEAGKLYEVRDVCSVWMVSVSSTSQSLCLSLSPSSNDGMIPYSISVSFRPSQPSSC